MYNTYPIKKNSRQPTNPLHPILHPDHTTLQPFQTTFGKKSTNIYNIEETDWFLRFEKIIE